MRLIVTKPSGTAAKLLAALHWPSGYSKLTPSVGVLYIRVKEQGATCEFRYGCALCNAVSPALE
jgi:hypothetical protein